MTVFTDVEKNFIKRAIVSTTKDIEEEIDPNKREDLITVMRSFRGRGYLTPRRSDQGKDYNMWHNIMVKLGVKLKTQEEVLREQEKNRAKGVMERLNEIHTSKINNLEKKIKRAKEVKKEVLLEAEKSIQKELEKIEKQKQDAVKRLEDARTARERIFKYRKEKEKTIEKNTDTGLMKCMECGEWFNGEKGLKIHTKKAHLNL